MSLLRNPIQKKLSALLGAQVTFEKLKLSPIGGVLDIHGMTVAGEDAKHPVLSVDRIRAEVAVVKALAGEIVVKSLTIERPILSIIRRADGSTNLPPRPNSSKNKETDTNDAPLRGKPPKRSKTGEAPAGDEEENEEQRWTLDAKKILLVGGEIHFRDESAPSYRASAGPILAELKRAGDDFEFTLLVESLGRRDVPVELGQLKGEGRLTNLTDFARIAYAGLEATLEVGASLRLSARCASLASRSGDLTASGMIDLPELQKLVPAALFVLPAAVSDARGRVELSLRAAYDPGDGMKIAELVLKALDVSIGGGKVSSRRN